MKNQEFNLAGLRQDWGKCKTYCATIKFMYLNKGECKNFAAALQGKDKDALCKLGQKFAEDMKIGSTYTRTVKGEEREFTVKFSADLVFRWLNKHNAEISELCRKQK